MSNLTSSVNIKLLFPEFKSMPDAIVEFAIAEASSFVDSTWIETDQILALSYLTAHFLMVRRSRAESGSGQQIKSRTIGRISTTYQTPEQPNDKDAEDFTTTPYGTRFMNLCTLNNPAVAII